MFIIRATVITIVNYDRNPFIVEVTKYILVKAMLERDYSSPRRAQSVYEIKPSIVGLTKHLHSNY
jgi:hypothetical protein